jgi:hypothetical protein
MPSGSQHWDVAISFAGEDREYAEELAQLLKMSGVKVFYDGFEEGKLWGEDLYVYLADVYGKRARFCVMFLSKDYARKLWTSHERKFAQARAFQENRAYILPVKLDDTEIAGIPATTGYVDLRQTTVDHVAALLLEKLEALDPDSGLALKGGDAEEAVRTAMQRQGTSFLVLLGDYGTGKTTLCKHLLVDLCRDLLEGKIEGPVPIYLEMRGAASILTAQDALAEILNSYKPMLPRGEHVRYLLLLDGYDEILRDQQGISLRSILNARLNQERVQVLLTSRTHFFKNELDVTSKLADQSKRGTGLSDLQLQIDLLLRNLLVLREFVKMTFRST